jgi:hypothetical protein
LRITGPIITGRGASGFTAASPLVLAAACALGDLLAWTFEASAVLGEIDFNFVAFTALLIGISTAFFVDFLFYSVTGVQLLAILGVNIAFHTTFSFGHTAQRKKPPCFQDGFLLRFKQVNVRWHCPY